MYFHIFVFLWVYFYLTMMKGLSVGWKEERPFLIRGSLNVVSCVTNDLNVISCCETQRIQFSRLAAIFLPHHFRSKSVHRLRWLSDYRDTRKSWKNQAQSCKMSRLLRIHPCKSFWQNIHFFSKSSLFEKIFKLSVKKLDHKFFNICTPKSHF